MIMSDMCGSTIELFRFWHALSYIIPNNTFIFCLQSSEALATTSSEIDCQALADEVSASPLLA